MYVAGCKRQLDRCSSDDPDTMVNQGCVLYKEGQFEAARTKFMDAMQILGYQVRLGATTNIRTDRIDKANVDCANATFKVRFVCRVTRLCV